MFARVTTVQTKVDKTDEAIKVSKESVLPVAKSQKGFAGACLLTEPSGKGIFVTFWGSEEDAINNEKSGYYQEQLAKFKDLFAAPPVHEGYEVAFRTD